MKTLSALLALCEGNPPITGGFPSQRPVTRSFDVFLWCAPEQTDKQNNLDAGDPRRHGAHYDVTVMAMVRSHVVWWFPHSWISRWPRCPRTVALHMKATDRGISNKMKGGETLFSVCSETSGDNDNSSRSGCGFVSLSLYPMRISQAVYHCGWTSHHTDSYHYEKTHLRITKKPTGYRPRHLSQGQLLQCMQREICAA